MVERAITDAPGGIAYAIRCLTDAKLQQSFETAKKIRKIFCGLMGMRDGVYIQ